MFRILSYTFSLIFYLINCRQRFQTCITSISICSNRQYLLLARTINTHTLYDDNILTICIYTNITAKYMYYNINLAACTLN